MISMAVDGGFGVCSFLSFWASSLCLWAAPQFIVWQFGKIEYYFRNTSYEIVARPVSIFWGRLVWHNLGSHSIIQESLRYLDSALWKDGLFSS
jgi:hypothetical protein